MGIKTEITQDELPLKYKKFNLVETQDGLTHSVYLLDNKYVLKIVEDTAQKTILTEEKLLDNLQGLCVPKLLDIYKKEKYTMVFYTQMRGKSLRYINTSHIKEIAVFLKNFHNSSKHLTSSNEKIYEKEYLYTLILETKEPLFLNYFNSINCTLHNDGVIHGDLFCDNAKFHDGKLSGVYDFIEACEGDFTFELAVVALSWCFDNEQLNTEKVQILLKNYGSTLDIKEFTEYIKYALLYYTTTRYLHNRDYKELLQRLESL